MILCNYIFIAIVIGFLGEKNDKEWFMLEFAVASE